MNTQPMLQTEMMPEIAKIVNYTQNRIDNWYSNAKQEYGTIGNATVSYDDTTNAFRIHGAENGKKTKFSIAVFDGVPTLDYVFNVWAEEFEIIENSQPQTLEVNQIIQCDGYRLIVTATKRESNKFAEANFANLNKNDKLSDYYRECASGDYTKQRIKILGTLCVNDKLFNELSNSLLGDWTTVDLQKFGGNRSDDPRLGHVTDFWKMTQTELNIFRKTQYLLCLQVTNVETEETFYVDSQTYSYARYVGIPTDFDCSPFVRVEPPRIPKLKRGKN